MSERRTKLLQLAVCAAVCAPAVWQLWLATHVFVERHAYPFDIDWLESASLYQAWRMMEGQFTYSTPDRGYLPLFHPIGYPAFLAAFGKLFGLDYAMARGLSFASLVATMVLGGAAVLHHAKSRIVGYMLAASSIGLVAAGLPLAGGFYDMVRCDTLSWLTCAVAAALASAEQPSRRRIVLLAAVMVCGVYVRLLTVFPCAWIGLVVLLRDRRRGLTLAAYVIGGCGVVLAALQWMSDGWYFTYTVTLLQRHAVHQDRIVQGLEHVMEHQAIAPLVVLGAVALGATKKLSHRGMIWAGVFVLSIPASLLPYGKIGGYYNDFMPMGLFVGPAATLVILDAIRLVPRTRLATAAPFVAGTAIAVYLALTPIDTAAFIPTPAQTERAKALNARVAGLQGGVLAPCHPFLPIRNGHRNDQYSEMPYIDAYWGELPGLALGRYLEQTQAQWMLLTNFEIDDSMAEVVARFAPHGRLVDTPKTIVGQQMRIQYVLQRKPPLRNARTVFDFESDEGWSRKGQAFEHSPTITTPAWQTPIRGATGSKVANSFHPRLGDTVVGSATSPPFLLDRDRLALDIGGGVGISAVLLVDGEEVGAAFPFMHNREILLRAVMDVSAHRGKQARLRLYDTNVGNWGHLIADNVLLYDPE